MEEIIKVIVYSVCGIITAASGLIITYLIMKAKQLGKEKEQLKDEVKRLHNGFRESVDKRLETLENRKCNKCGR